MMNMNIKTTVMSMVVFFSFGMTSVVNAAPTTTDQQATQALVRQLTGLRSFSADFEQTTKANIKSNAPKKAVSAQHLNQKFTGVMKVERPGKFYWETMAPSKQIIVTSGKTIWIYDPDLQQVVRQTVSDQVANTPALLLSGNTAQIMQSYTVSQPDVSKSYYTLIPKNTEGSFQDLSIGFAKDGTPNVMILNDALGQTTTINFNRVIKNTKITPSTFNFVPPKGTDIIDQ